MKIVDLTHTFGNETPVFPGDDKTQLEQVNFLEKDYYNAYRLETGLHTGTHIDMPMHKTDDKRFASEFAVERFIGKAFLIEAVGEKIVELKPEHEQIEKDDIVLVHTGFDKFYSEDKYFSAHSVISDELSEFLINRKIKMIGIDTPSPDSFPYKTHEKYMAADIFILENLANMEQISGWQNFEVIALPLKIEAEASPVRVVARKLPDSCKKS